MGLESIHTTLPDLSARLDEPLTVDPLWLLAVLLWFLRQVVVLAVRALVDEQPEVGSIVDRHDVLCRAGRLGALPVDDLARSAALWSVTHSRLSFLKMSASPTMTMIVKHMVWVSVTSHPFQ